jgi:CDP-glycerol glycerophosphotransferase (TagB/SpsB family)
MPLDLEFYKKNRGFELEPYEFWTPGIKVFSQEKLEEVLINYDDKDYSVYRKNIRDIMFAFQDGDSAKRIFETIFQ